MDRCEEEILRRFEARADEIADEIAECTMAEVPGFAPINDRLLFAEIRALSRQHLDAFVEATRSGRPPRPEILAAARERAIRRAREMVPLASLLHSYLIAQRLISAAIAREGGEDAQSRGAALALTARTFDYNITITTAMADAYVEVVQGDLAELDSARRGLIEALLTSQPDTRPVLTRRAIGLGFDPDRAYVVVVAFVGSPESTPPRWAAQAIARSSGRPERSAFVISRERDLVALLDAAGGNPPRVVLQRAAAAIHQTNGVMLRAGIGTQFVGLDGFSASYQEARRALRHTHPHRPFVFGPGDMLLFDELTTAGGDGAVRLIPETTRQVLADGTLRVTLEAFVEADLNVAAAANALSLHPNSLRYRIRRIAEKTGRDPQKLADLLELIAAARVISATTA